MQIIGTYWAIIPAVVAIILALFTKQVYIALFAGVLVGGLLLEDGNPFNALMRVLSVMADSLGSNGGILIFVALLGIIVVMITNAGGAKAFSEWVSDKIKTKRGVMVTTACFGMFMFLDDYFNRLTVGAVMRSSSDSHKISRIRFAYIIGAVSSAICILVPMSSWTGAVVSDIAIAGGSESPFTVLLKTISVNYYPILSIGYVMVLSFFDLSFFGVKKYEDIAIKTGDVRTGFRKPQGVEEIFENIHGKVIDLMLPIVMLIIICFGSMVYTGFFMKGTTILNSPQSITLSEAISNCNIGISLALGGTLSLIFTSIYYFCRKLISSKIFYDSFSEGLKSISDVLIILILAWGLSGICTALDTTSFIASLTANMGKATVLLPVLLFLLSLGIAFATGTSWGTFGILIPIVAAMSFEGISAHPSTIYYLALAATLSGSVMGNQISPISDATILTASSAKADHGAFVKAQIPNSFIVAGASLLGYLVAGLTSYGWAGWIVAIVSLSVTVFIMALIQKKCEKKLTITKL